MNSFHMIKYSLNKKKINYHKKFKKSTFKIICNLWLDIYAFPSFGELNYENNLLNIPPFLTAGESIKSNESN